MSGWARVVRRIWSRHGLTLLVIMGVCMLLAALWRVPTALSFLLWRAEEPYPTDLLARHGEVSRWFQGIAVDPRGGRADYPPASYPLLWPLVGWLSLTHARWLWGLTAMAALGLFAYQATKASGATTRAQRLPMQLLPFSSYAASATLSVGQLGNHVVPMAVGGMILFCNGRKRRWQDLAGTVMFLFALVKPILTAPFFWVVCFATGRIRPAMLVVLGYIALTLFAVSFQSEDLLTVLTGWLGETVNLLRGHANLHKGLALLSLQSWALPATIVTLVLTGWWIYRHRQSELWTLLSVAALVARLAFHHRLYDDMLLLVPMVTLFRMALTGPETGGRDLLAGMLFTLMWLTVHLPVQLLMRPAPVPALVEISQTAVWILVLIFLVDAARRDTLSRRALFSGHA